MSRYGRYYGFAPYVPVAVQRQRAEKQLKKMLKKGAELQPVELEGRTIARTFWGKAWCDNLESYMDYENRLPRGRRYVRNGSVLHLEVSPGLIAAKVAGTSLYTVAIRIQPVPRAKWQALCKECAGQIGSLLELLSGKMSNEVMRVMTRRETGLFPSPREIQLDCSCPDWADMCKHVAAVLYGVGARLDSQPELLFVLRGADHNELITEAVAADVTAGDAPVSPEDTVDAGDLADVFGIELVTGDAPGPVAPAAPKTKKKAAAKPVKPAKKETKIAGKRAATPKKKPITRTTAKPAAKKTAPKAVSAKKPVAQTGKQPAKPAGKKIATKTVAKPAAKAKKPAKKSAAKTARKPAKQAKSA